MKCTKLYSCTKISFLSHLTIINNCCLYNIAKKKKSRRKLEIHCTWLITIKGFLNKKLTEDYCNKHSIHGPAIKMSLSTVSGTAHSSNAVLQK